MTKAQARRANAAIAALLFVALPLATSNAMPRLIQGHGWLVLDVAVSTALAAVSLNLLFGYTGQISLGHAGLLGIGAFTSGIVTSRLHLSMLVGLPVAVLVSALVALVIGVPALRLRGLYLAIVTVVFGLTMQYSVFRSDIFSGGSAGIPMPRRVWGDNLLTDNATFLVVCLLVVIVIWAIDVNITSTRVGRAFMAIRESEPVAQSFGINVVRYKLLAFVISGAMAGVAGALYGHAIGFVNNETFSLNLSLQLVIMVIVGGAGSRLAVMLAAVFFILLPNFISGLHGWEYVVGAVGLMLAVSRHPGGIAEMLARRRERATVEDDDDVAADDRAPLPDASELLGCGVDATGGLTVVRSARSDRRVGAIRRSPRGRRRAPHRPARSDRRAHRPERRRQEHAVQRDHRNGPHRQRPSSLPRARDPIVATRPAGTTRHRAQLPTGRARQGPVDARELPARPAPARRRTATSAHSLMLARRPR